MQQVLKTGSGWRLGWNPMAEHFQGLVGSDEWSLELTIAELQDFCRLAVQLADTIAQLHAELMPEETIACEVESDLLWLEADGYPHAYSLHLIVLTGRRGEGEWRPEALPELLQAVRSLQNF